MDDRSVCTPLTVESDAPNNTTSSPNAASVTCADKVINTKIDITQVEGDKSDEELLKDLLTDEYCHVCEAVLLFESQRLSHYEGKRHAQKVKVYLQAKRAEKINKDSTGPQWTMTTDKDRFCELCNMVFSSHVVAKSHYEGKVHTKNLRKQGLHPPERNPEVHTFPILAQDPDNSEQKSSPEGGTGHVLDPTATTATSSTEVDLKDPNKYCALCVASFNNPQMALQHYNGRKHQRNQARQELLRELGDDAHQAEALMCQMCSLQFNSVEMYQAHMQGNKHQIREKKVVDLCKSQQKVYGTFADELADYIQVQKARGITLKTNQVLAQGDTHREGEDDDEEEEDQEVLNEGEMIEPNKLMPNLPPTSNPPHPSHHGSYYPAEMCPPSYQGPPWASQGWSYNYPPPVLPYSGNPQFTSRPIKRKRHRKQSSSSSYSTSSSYSSYSSSSSSTSDSDDSEHRRREKKRIRRSRRERGRRGRDVDSDKEERRRRKRRRRERVSEERRREQSVESEEEGRRKKLRNHGKHRRKDKKIRKENFEVERDERVTGKLKSEDVMENRKDTELHIEAEIDVEREDGQDEAAKPKFRKEKKKTKDKVDTRTEEEKLWDDSILGC